MLKKIFVYGVMLIGISCYAQKGEWAPEILQSGSDVYLPDFSYAGYHNGEKRVPRKKPTLNVVDFGAVPNDGNDDTAAFKRALEAAGANTKADVIRIPEGRFIISEILVVNQENIVLQGSGSGSDGTTLYVPQPLSTMPFEPESEKLLEYIHKKDKREGDRYYSPFSWSGGIIWVKRTEKVKGAGIKTAAVRGTRGEHSIEVENAKGIKPGMLIQVKWYNPDGKGGSFLKHLFNTAESKCGANFYSNPNKIIVHQPLQVVSVRGNKLKVKEPLLHDIRPEWKAQLVSLESPLKEVGLENFCIEFPSQGRGEWQHHLEPGYNGIYLQDARNCWIQNVEIENADSAIILARNTSLVTMKFVKITGGVKGHYTVCTAGYGNLVKAFEFTAPAGHSPSFNTGCSGCVYTTGSIVEPRIDQHCGGNQQNLIDNVKLTGVTDELFKHGGGSYNYPAAAAFNTFWNVFVSGQTNLVFPKKTIPWHARFIGLHGDMPLDLDYHSSAYIEGLNRDDISVRSLYIHQFKKRLKKR